jgi:EmrB/QacA subfamily drug resistance transporter
MPLHQNASRLAQRTALRLFRKPANKETAEAERKPQGILVGLMTPLVMVVLQGAMVAVALPDIRSSFDSQADLMAWVVTGFTLSFMILMPLYGRLGDGFGKRTLLLVGIIIFLVGICISILASSLPLLILGRVIQGAGASAVIPLTIVMISELFPANQRGRVLGTWNSVAPGSSVATTLLSGLLIATWGWRSVFVPALAVGLLALFVLRRNVPDVPGNAQPGFLRAFDWVGMILISATVTALLFYVSSRTVTGVPALRDWRLLIVVSVLAGGFILWEKRRPNPFISLDIFTHRSFNQASVCAAARMFAVASIIFLIPLYLVDVLELDVAGVGVVLAIHCGALFATMQPGGLVADRRGSHWPVVAGLSVQVGVLVYLALLSSSATLPLVIIGLTVHGLGAGLAQAPLDRAATEGMPQAQIGAAAGVYSMIRFGGAMLGPTLAGVLLQQGLDRGLSPIDAYQVAFWLVASVTSVGVLVGLTLRE